MFWYLIAIINVVILVGILGVFTRMRRALYDEDELEAQLNNRGLLNRLLGRFIKSITASWHMYPVGLLFGLGFDTATEVALLVLAGTSVAAGLRWYAILWLPVLFTAGMCLLDTIDGSFMNFAYGWAFPTRFARSTTTSPSPACRSSPHCSAAVSNCSGCWPVSSVGAADSGAGWAASTSTRSVF